MMSRAQAPAWSSYGMWAMGTTLAIQAGVIVLTKSPGIGNWGFHYYRRHATQSQHFALIAMLLFAGAAVCSYLLTHFVAVKSSVRELGNPAVLRARTLPHFIQQDRNSVSLIKFRKNFDVILGVNYCDSLAKAVAIRQWVREQQSQDEKIWLGPYRRDHENPQRLLEEQRNGVPGACRRFSYILLGALLSAGFDARIACFTSSLRRRGGVSHVTVEAWIEELKQWVLLDPTFDTVCLIEGKVASALELQEAVVRGQTDSITFERDGARLWPHPSPAAYGLYCRHLFVATSNAIFDGYSVRLVGPRRIRFLHYSREAAYPKLRKQVLLSLAGSGLFLSAMFWGRTLLALAGE